MDTSAEIVSYGSRFTIETGALFTFYFTGATVALN